MTGLGKTANAHLPGSSEIAHQCCRAAMQEYDRPDRNRLRGVRASAIRASSRCILEFAGANTKCATSDQSSTHSHASRQKCVIMMPRLQSTRTASSGEVDTVSPCVPPIVMCCDVNYSCPTRGPRCTHITQSRCQKVTISKNQT